MKLIQAGVGGMGRTWWKNAITQNNVEVAAIVDVADAPLAEAGEALGVPENRRFKSLADAIQAVPADAVLTVTPPPVHLEHAKLAFSNGLHLLTEKPIAGTFAQAREMVQHAQQAGKLLMVAQNYRYSATMQTLKRLMREQPLGAFGHGHIDFYIPGDFRGTFRETMEYPLLIDMAIHHIDLIRAITARNIVKVTAQTFKPQWSWYQHDPGLKMLLELDDGIPFSYSGDWSARGHCTTWNGAWRLQCEQGSLELTHDDKIIQTTSSYFGKDQASQQIAADAVAKTGQAALMARFVDAIENKSALETSGQDNLWSFAAVMAGVKSAQERRTVEVAEIIEG